MKKTLLVGIALVAGVAMAEMKVGTVDMLKLVRNHSSYESNKSLLKETEKDFQKKLGKINAELDSIQEEYKKLSEQLRQPMLAAAAKAKIEKDIMELQNKGLNVQQRLRTEAMRSQQDLQDLEARLLRSTSNEIRKKITEFAEANGYDLVIDASAAPYSKPALNVTDEVLKAMGVDPAKAVEFDATGSAKGNEGK